jgi:DNA polymerase-3 subunit epsilon
MSLFGRLKARWRAAPPVESDDTRWVVADVESSGLDPTRDRLLAIAAIALHFDASDRLRPRIVFGDGFEMLLRQPADPAGPVDKANILLHGIGVGAQRGGSDPGEVLAAWERFIDQSPLVAYHSRFDQTLIDRASRAALGRAPINPWLDLEPLAAVVHGDPQRRSLDHWLQRHGIACVARHQAAADTLATAQLLLTLWPAVRQRCDGRFAAVADLAEGHRFLPGRR